MKETTFFEHSSNLMSMTSGQSTPYSMLNKSMPKKVFEKVPFSVENEFEISILINVKYHPFVAFTSNLISHIFRIIISYYIILLKLSVLSSLNSDRLLIGVN